MQFVRLVINKNLRKWANSLSKTLGIHIDPSCIVIWATFTILTVQLIIYLSASQLSDSSQSVSLKLNDSCRLAECDGKLPTVYVITPTYERYVQKAELTRLSHTLLLVPNLHWILVEDSKWPSELVKRFVFRLKNKFNFHSITHLYEPTPKKFKLKPGEPSWKYPKGVWQRNKALDWIRDNLADLDLSGAIYFADDDNTYDLELFDEIRQTDRVSVWPVAFVGGLLVEKPLVNDEDKVQSFNSMWRSDRPFPIDMAGFAISLRHYEQHKDAKFSSETPVGYLESHFLGQLVKRWSELEPRAERCRRILVWHTKTQKPSLHEETKLHEPSNSDTIW